jgi:hypothetical protein
MSWLWWGVGATALFVLVLGVASLVLVRKERQ